MKMKTLLFIIMLLGIATPVNAQQKMFKDGVGIASIAVVMPVGRVLLIGRDNSVGAVKFLHNEERQEGTYSKYEYFEYEKGEFKRVGEGEVVLKKPASGKGIFFHGSPDKLAGPPLKLRNFSLFAAAAGMEHSTVYFWSKPNKVDQRVRMAPTPWKEIGEAELSDPRIRWFTYTEKESWKVIPIDQIWD
jgi:hypothetical protein